MWYNPYPSKVATGKPVATVHSPWCLQLVNLRFFGAEVF